MTEDFKRLLPNGFRISEPYSESKQAKYVAEMTKELKDRPNRRVKPVPTHFNGKPISELTAAEKEDFYFSMQPASTQAAMLAQKSRHPSEDIDHLLRPMPACIANPDAKDLDDLTAMRSLKPDEISIEEKRRRGAKNELGSSKAPSVDGRKRDRGIEAFTYSRPATLSEDEVKKLTKMAEIEAISPEFSPKAEEIPQKIGFWKRLKWLFKSYPGESLEEFAGRHD